MRARRVRLAARDWEYAVAVREPLADKRIHRTVHFASEDLARRFAGDCRRRGLVVTVTERNGR